MTGHSQQKISEQAERHRVLRRTASSHMVVSPPSARDSHGHRPTTSPHTPPTRSAPMPETRYSPTVAPCDANATAASLTHGTASLLATSTSQSCGQSPGALQLTGVSATANRPLKQLSVSAVPWYPPAVSVGGSIRAESTCSQPFREDEFPCEPQGHPRAHPGGAHSTTNSVVGGGSLSRFSAGGSPPSFHMSPLHCSTDGDTPPHSVPRRWTNHNGNPHRGNSTPSQSGGDEDDIVVMVRFRDDEAQDEEAMIRRLAEGAFWSTDAPAAEGLHHIRSVWDVPHGGGGAAAFPPEDGEDDFSDWEDDSAAYEDSLDSEQLDWLEEQLQARENPENFFF